MTMSSYENLHMPPVSDSKPFDNNCVCDLTYKKNTNSNDIEACLSVCNLET